MKTARLFAALCAPLLALAACTSPGGSDAGDTVDRTPSLTAAETAEVADGVRTDMEALQMNLESSSVFEALAYLAMPSGPSYPLETDSSGPAPLALARAIGPLAADADTTLARGVYAYDRASGWSEVEASDDLVARWTFTDADDASHEAEATIDWDVETGTTVAADTNGTTSEVPRGARAVLDLDGKEAARFDLDVAWRDTATCGTILQPTGATLDGYVGDDAGKVTLDALSLSVSGDGRIHTSGGVEGAAGGESASYGWTIDLEGALATDEDGCFWNDYDVSGGSAEVRVSSTHHSLVLGFDLERIVRDEDDQVVGVDVANGILRVDGETALTFSGTFDDADDDRIPGDHLDLRFVDGETTLEAFLIQQELVARGEAALRTLGVLR